MRSVRQGPGSALASVDRRRFFSAHSVTVRSSGGFMPAKTFVMTAFSLFTRSRASFSSMSRRVSLSVIGITPAVSFPGPPLPDALLVFLWVIAVVGELPHGLVDLAADDLGGLRWGVR